MLNTLKLLRMKENIETLYCNPHPTTGRGCIGSDTAMNKLTNEAYQRKTYSNKTEEGLRLGASFCYINYARLMHLNQIFFGLGCISH